MDSLRPVPLDSHLRLQAFEDVVLALSVPRFRFAPTYNACELRPDHGGALVIEGDLWDGHAHAGRLKRTLLVRQRIAVHDLLVVEPDYRAAGLAPLLLRQSFLFYDRVGIERVFLLAALETGRWYWAWMGFDFVDPADAQSMRAWFQVAIEALGLDTRLDVSQLSRAYEFATQGTQLTPEATVSLADLGDAMMNREPQLRRLLGPQHFEEAAKHNGLDRNQDIPLARAVMLAFPSNWLAVMDLDMRRPQRTLFETKAQNKLRRVAQ